VTGLSSINLLTHLLADSSGLRKGDRASEVTFVALCSVGRILFFCNGVCIEEGCGLLADGQTCRI